MTLLLKAVMFGVKLSLLYIQLFVHVIDHYGFEDVLISGSAYVSV